MCRLTIISGQKINVCTDKICQVELVCERGWTWIFFMIDVLITVARKNIDPK